MFYTEVELWLYNACSCQQCVNATVLTVPVKVCAAIKNMKRDCFRHPLVFFFNIRHPFYGVLSLCIHQLSTLKVKTLSSQFGGDTKRLAPFSAPFLSAHALKFSLEKCTPSLKVLFIMCCPLMSWRHSNIRDERWKVRISKSLPNNQTFHTGSFFNPLVSCS